MASCIVCNLNVRPRQEGLQCDGCQRWQHRKCGSGISQAEYRLAVRTSGEIDWQCSSCSAQNVQSFDQSNEQTVDQPNFDPNTSELGSFVEPAVHEESELEDPVPAPQPVVVPQQNGPAPLTYTVVEAASNRGKDILLDSLGYRYAQKVDKKRTAVTWRCHKRSKNSTCKATVMERNGCFIRGSQHHICTAEPGQEKVLDIRKEVKERARKRVFDSAAEIVEEVLVEQTAPGELTALPTLPRPVNIAQQANRKRQKTRPQEPQDLDFVLDPNQLDDPSFLQKDIRVGSSRH